MKRVAFLIFTALSCVLVPVSRSWGVCGSLANVYVPVGEMRCNMTSCYGNAYHDDGEQLSLRQYKQIGWLPSGSVFDVVAGSVIENRDAGGCNTQAYNALQMWFYSADFCQGTTGYARSEVLVNTCAGGSLRYNQTSLLRVPYLGYTASYGTGMYTSLSSGAADSGCFKVSQSWDGCID